MEPENGDPRFVSFARICLGRDMKPEPLKPSDRFAFSRAIAARIARIYPGYDTDILVTKVIEAFWPDGSHRRKRMRTQPPLRGPMLPQDTTSTTLRDVELVTHMVNAGTAT
jgi:hypothetical protein